jgi:hypothetical protein
MAHRSKRVVSGNTGGGITPHKIHFVSDQRQAKVFNATYSGLFKRVKCLGSENISIEEVV